jgi:folate-dependent phosphoribosylglycinamide formyltransferase PurN
MSHYQKIEDQESVWGALFLPLNPRRQHEGALRTVVFGSTNAGALVIESLEMFEKKYPDRFNLVGVATDDPCDPNTKISVQRRIWKYYSGGEMCLLMNKVINLATEEGVPCYTGSIKTDYFRDILRQWNPDVIIMCCFGQKVDAFVFDYPKYGMYNFHPSDLAANIGEGSQPFHDTMNNDKRTSVMTVHLVNEYIDRGPIVGKSPEINIRKADNSYPLNILSLQEKIPAICGWLSIELILEVLERKASGEQGPLTSVDFNRLTPEYIKQRIMEPANDDLTDRYLLPLHDALK